MRNLIFAALFSILPCLAVAQGINNPGINSIVCNGTTIVASGTCSTRGQVPGTTTNDNASAGNVGEYILSNIAPGSAVSLTSGAPANVTSVSLTGGDWEVCGNTVFRPDAITVIYSVAGWTSAASAAYPADANGGNLAKLPFNVETPNDDIALTMSCSRYSVASTTTVYLSAVSYFTTSTLTAFGFIGARRMR